MSTYNLCFELKYEKKIRIFIWKFSIFGGKFLVYLNRLVFVMSKFMSCFYKWTVKDLIRLHGCAGWSGTFLFCIYFRHLFLIILSFFRFRSGVFRCWGCWASSARRRKIHPIERQGRPARPMRILLLKRLTLLPPRNSDLLYYEDACFGC